MSAQALEIRMAHLEGAYEQINHHLGTVEQRLGSLETRMGAGFARIDERFAQVDTRFSQVDARFVRIEQRMDRTSMWRVGLMVASILLPIVQRFVVR
ncbi:MAG: hypothetical protein JO322_13055 [Candidatus Eremiobacteraeota bacterium]|nr:hypothetical protein [Candidatus Eremiobacteraeota bacterium]